ncbi:pentatricopeptide repeat-containing protein, putative [Ricinus communis]|uniref:Pentatricopeptide repeat-containing protein, putative n=1 Tax=Ricinus communis TaxID=3988 RepID=B9S8T7_RICCO|nr:pentatricopeptide repeat-containing protein, putative [Ricinus communis]
MVDGYAKLGYVDIARKFFDNMPDRDVVACNAMMSGYVQNGYCMEALDIFHDMQRESYLANIRLKGVSSDVLITAYEPVLINPLSETARTVGAGMAAPAAQSGFLPMSEVFKLAVSTFKVNDWNLFGSAAV